MKKIKVCCKTPDTPWTETLKELQYIAYEKFKLWWMIQHDYTVADLMAKYSDYWGEVESDEDGMVDFWTHLEETGFAGSIWPCIEEFLDYEFKNFSLMYTLLTQDQYTFYLSNFSNIFANNTRHISEVKEGDVLLYDNCRYVATTDAYMTDTDIGREWNVEVESDEGSEEYLYASYFPQGEVMVVKAADENADEAEDEDCDGECVGCERACADRIAAEEVAV